MLAVVKVVGSSVASSAIGAVVYLLGRRRAKRHRLKTTCARCSSSSFAGVRGTAPAASAGPAHDARGLLPHGQRQGGTLQPRPRRRSSRCRGRATRRGRSTTTNRGKYFFEVVDAASGTVAVLARLQLDLRRVGDDRRGARRSNRTFSESLRFPAPTSRSRIVVKKRDARNVFRDDLDASTVDPGRQVRRHAARQADAGRADQAARERRSGDEARPADPRRRLHRRASAASSSATRGGSMATLFATSPFKERAARHQRLGARARRRRSRASRGRRSASTALAGRRDLRRVRLRALRAHVREQGVPRHRGERAVRRRRDPDQQRDLRRRRHLRPVQHGRRRQRVGAVHLRPRVRAPHRRPGRRVLHLGRRLSAGQPIASSRGSRT